MLRTHSHNGGIDIMNFLNYSPTMEMKDPVTGVYNMDPYNSVNGNPFIILKVKSILVFKAYTYESP